MIPTDMPFEFKRLQFPILLAFAMTINKSQGQSLKVCGLNLEYSCFLFVFVPDNKTKNVVYHKCFIKSACRVRFLFKLGLATYPFEILSIDTMGGLGSARPTKTYLHLLVDHFTRYAFILTSITQNKKKVYLLPILFTAINTPFFNGLNERLNQTLVNKIS
uniref:SFRICE_038769 n=1 Tax=Spodoptera frugiperda TaxID=7108 RepID=A0A2H1VCF4_SPOFR